MVDTCPELFLADGLWFRNDRFSYLHCGGNNDFFGKCGMFTVDALDGPTAPYHELETFLPYQMHLVMEIIV